MRNQGVILAVAISFLVIAFVFIYVSQFYIPNQTKKISQQYEGIYNPVGVFVVTAEDGLAEGTIITEDLFNEGTITVENIPAAFIPSKGQQGLVYTTMQVSNGSVTEAHYSEMIGKVVKSKIESGSIISYASLGEGEEVNINNFEKQIQLDIENTVGDNLKTGKYVDVIVKYENGEFDVVASKKIIDSVVSTGVIQDTGDGSSTSQTKITADTDGVIMLSVNDREYRDIELAKRLGTISIRLYKSADQYPSEITFNYGNKASLVNKQITELELVGEHNTYYDEFGMLMDGKHNVDKNTELFVFMEWYSDIYYKVEPLIEGKRIYEKQSEADTYKQTNGELAEEVITLDEIAESIEMKPLDVVIALIMGNQKIYSTSNRLEIFNSLQKMDPTTATGIRIQIGSELVNKATNYYTSYAGTNVDSLAYLIKNGFINSTKLQ